MKPETLDALLIDRALGELAPETTELLEAYLAQSPAAARQADELAHTVAAARRTAVPVYGTTTPGFEWVAAALGGEERRARRRKYGLVMLRVAAGVALGVGLGWLWFAPPNDSRPSGRVVQSVTPHHDGATSGFWSLQNFVRPSSGSASASAESKIRGRWKWESPFRKPKLEEMP